MLFLDMARKIIESALPCRANFAPDNDRFFHFMCVRSFLICLFMAPRPGGLVLQQFLDSVRDVRNLRNVINRARL